MRSQSMCSVVAFVTTACAAGAAPRILKRTLQTALVWTLYEELVPRMSALYMLATAQQAADSEDRAAAAAAEAGQGNRRQ
jgi:solute carrier family 25 protein 38